MSSSPQNFNLSLHSNLLLNANSQESLVYSPFSLVVALCMLALGAKDGTLSEINTLHQCSHSKNQILINQLMASSSNEGIDTVVTNAMYPMDGITLNPTFKKQMTQYYDAEVKPQNYAEQPEQSRLSINNDVSESTRGMIQDLLPPGSITQDTRNVLVNTIYFKGEWKHAFPRDQTQLRSFTLFSGENKQVQMMESTEKRRYQWVDYGNGVESLILPFKGENFSMEFVRPSSSGEGVSPSADALYQAEQRVLSSEGTRKTSSFDLIRIPRFTLDSFHNLKPVLEGMGLQTAFSPANANFSNMFLSTTSSRNDFYVSGIFQKARMLVNEEGSEAAAATGAVVSVTSVPLPTESKQFVLDSPFTVLLKYKNDILFVGRVVSPSAE